MGITPSLTTRIQSFMQGDTAAIDALLREVMPRLLEIAASHLKRERYVAPVSKTELINELWVRHLSKGGWQVNDRSHFYILASMAMRRVLIDLARRRLTQCRNSGEAPLSLEGSESLIGTSLAEAERIVEIGLLMDRLEAKHPVEARIVDMSYFSGFTMEEIAVEIKLSPKQVRLRHDKGMTLLRRMLHAQKRVRSKGAVSGR